jgi:hypothetical protein
VQQFIGEGGWDDDRILERHQQLVAADLGEPDGTVIVDGSGFPKKGEHSVGVQRQYCGALGKLANCQQGVFLVYASRHGHTFLDRRLYITKTWFDDAHAAKRRKCGLPLKSGHFCFTDKRCARVLAGRLLATHLPARTRGCRLGAARVFKSVQTTGSAGEVGLQN